MRRLPLLPILVISAILVVALLVWWWLPRPAWTLERIQDTVVTTLQAEAPASDLVTGRVGITARREIQDRGGFSWIPGWVGMPGVNLTRAAARVEVRGEALYGFDVRSLDPSMIVVGEDGVVEVTLPPLHVVAVEASLAELRVTSDEGLLRRGAGESLRAEALRDVDEALRLQAERHLATSSQPRVNTARALAEMLRPPLEAAGMPDPRFRFRLGDNLVLEPSPETGSPAARPR